MNFIKEIKFNNDGTKNELNYKKKTLLKTELDEFTKVVLSKESNTESIDINDITIIRLKNRITLYLEEFKNYKIDVTLSYTFKGNEINYLKNLRTKYLPKINNVSDFLKNSVFDNNVKYEIEFERLSDGDNTIDLESEVENIKNYMGKYLNSKDVKVFNNTLNNHQSFLVEIAKLIAEPFMVSKIIKKEFTFKQLGNKPIELNKNSYYSDVNIKDYYLTEKTDGKRAFVYIKNKTVYSLTMDTFKEIAKINDDKAYLFDCELQENNNNSIYLIFDMMIYKNENLINTNFEKRYNLLKDMKFESNVPLSVKYMYKLTGVLEADKTEAEKFNKKKDIDGLIFTNAVDIGYYKMQIYKWKPIANTTIDFYVKHLKDTKYVLFCGINKVMANDLNLISHYNYLFNKDFKNDDYYPIEFNNSDGVENYIFNYNGDEDINDKIVEFRYDVNPDYKCGVNEKGKWVIIKIRNEYKNNYYGNDFKTCQLIFINYNNPLLFEDLFGKNTSYFNKDGDDAKAMKKFNLGVKHAVFDHVVSNYLKNKDVSEGSSEGSSSNVIDLSCGRGADMFYFASLKFKYGMFCDIDKSAISDLLYRFFNYKKTKQDIYDMKINTLILNLLDDANDNYCKISEISKVKYQLVSMQFAIHYFIGNFRNLCKLVSMVIDDNGYFVFTCFNGSKLMSLFKNNEIKYGDYHIIKLDDKKINVKLPFSDSYYEEYMVFDDFITEHLKHFGMEKIENGNFSKYFDSDVEKKINAKGLKLNDDDKKFSSLYDYYIYKKTGKGFDVKLSDLIVFKK